MDWLNLIHEHTEEGIVVMLIGNKYDLVKNQPSKRKISEVEIMRFCNAHGLFHMETSAKTGHNV